MQVLYWNFAAFLIAALYYVWRDLYSRKKRKQLLRQRVAYMLWTAANLAARVEYNEPSPQRPLDQTCDGSIKRFAGNPGS